MSRKSPVVPAAAIALRLATLDVETRPRIFRAGIPAIRADLHD